MATAAQVRDSARALLGLGSTDQQAGSDAEMLQWLNFEYPRVRAAVARVVPDRYTAAVTFDVFALANTYTVIATDYEAPRKVGRRSGSGSPYSPLPLLSFVNAEHAPSLGWRRRGALIEFFPMASAPNTAGVDNYQLTYLTKAGTLAAGTTLDLPDGVERTLEWSLVARGRYRLGEDPRSAEAMAREALRADLLMLAEQYPGANEGTADLTGYYV